MYAVGLPICRVNSCVGYFRTLMRVDDDECGIDDIFR